MGSAKDFDVSDVQLYTEIELHDENFDFGDAFDDVPTVRERIPFAAVYESFGESVDLHDYEV